jgi:hypothetical protein
VEVLDSLMGCDLGPARRRSDVFRSVCIRRLRRCDSQPMRKSKTSADLNPINSAWECLSEFVFFLNYLSFICVQIFLCEFREITFIEYFFRVRVHRITSKSLVK